MISTTCKGIEDVISSIKSRISDAAKLFAITDDIHGAVFGVMERHFRGKSRAFIRRWFRDSVEEMRSDFMEKANRALNAAKKFDKEGNHGASRTLYNLWGRVEVEYMLDADSPIGLLVYINQLISTAVFVLENISERASLKNFRWEINECLMDFSIESSTRREVVSVRKSADACFKKVFGESYRRIWNGDIRTPPTD